MIDKASAGVVVAATASAASGDIKQAMVSLALGLCGVLLARAVFIGRQNRILGRKQPWQETLPLTLAAMLATGVIIADQKLGKSASAFMGLGAGWTSILILEIAGERLSAVLRAALGGRDIPVIEEKPKPAKFEDPLPKDMTDLLDKLD